MDPDARAGPTRPDPAKRLLLARGVSSTESHQLDEITREYTFVCVLKFAVSLIGLFDFRSKLIRVLKFVCGFVDLFIWFKEQIDLCIKVCDFFDLIV